MSSEYIPKTNGMTIDDILKDKLDKKKPKKREPKKQNNSDENIIEDIKKSLSVWNNINKKDNTQNMYDENNNKNIYKNSNNKKGIPSSSINKSNQNSNSKHDSKQGSKAGYNKDKGDIRLGVVKVNYGAVILEFILLLTIYVILSQRFVIEYMTSRVVYLVPDEDGAVGMKGILFYGLTLTSSFFILRKLFV